MKELFLLLFIYSGMNLFAQQMDSIGEVIYLDSENKTTHKDLAVYYKFKIPYKDNGFKFLKYIIKNATEAQLVEKFFEDSSGLKQGKYESYTNTGENEKSGYYLNDLKFGNWKIYEYMFIPNSESHRRGQITHYLKGNYIYQDDLKNGPFKKFHENGAILAEGSYKNDCFVDACKWYFKNGQLSSLENYDSAGVLLNIQQWNEDGTEYNGEKAIIKGPFYEKLDASNPISKRIKKYFNLELITKYKRNLNVVISCYINEEGKITSIDIKSQEYHMDEYNNEIRRILPKGLFVGISYYHNQPRYKIVNIPFKVSWPK